MTLKLPNFFRGIDGKLAYEKIMAEASGEIKGGEKRKSITTKANITKLNYIQIPGQDFVIAIDESDFNLNYEDAQKAVLQRGIYVPTPREFMLFHNHVIDCYKKSQPIFDTAGNPLSDTIRGDLYGKLTSDCWTWLNGRFYISDKKKTIESITGLDSSDNLLTKTEELEDYLVQDCYIDFKDITKQGLALKTSKYSSQNFSKGNNIYFYSPRDNRVARFYAGSVRVNLGCNGYPSNRSPSLGVRGLIRGA